MKVLKVKISFWLHKKLHLLIFLITEGPGAEVLQELHYKVIENIICDLYFNAVIKKGHLCARGRRKQNICEVCTTFIYNNKHHCQIKKIIQKV